MSSSCDDPRACGHLGVDPRALRRWRHWRCAADLSRIETIVVIYPENRSFDHLYGLFPGANGIANATKEQYTQRDHDGSVLPYLRVWDSHGKADPEISGAAERAVPDRCAAGGPVGRPDAAEPDPRLLPQHRADQRRPERHVRCHVDGRRLHDGLLRRQRHEAVAVGEGVHAGGQLLHGRVRRLLSQSSIPDLRVHARLQGRAASRCGRGSTPTASWRRSRTLPPRAMVPCGPTRGGLGGQITPDGFSVNTTQPPYQPSGIAPAVGGPLELADAKGTERLGLPLPPQTQQDDRRHALGQGCRLGLVCGRLERSPRGRRRAARRASSHLHARRTTPSISSRTISPSTISAGLRRARRIASCI